MSRKDRSPPAAGQTLGFLLIDNMALISWAAVAEPFRAANTLSGESLYSWRLISTGPDRAATASNGARIVTDACVADDLKLDTLFVCVGGDPAAFNDRAVFAWLRRLARRGVRLVGVSGGTYVLARAGVMAGYRCTIHWEYLPAFRQRFPEQDVVQALFVIDRDRLTCAGGVAGLDLALEIIAADHGAKLAAMVGEWYIRTELREGARSQRMALSERYGVSNARVLQALAIMEVNVASPAPRTALADMLAITPRQLDRLFAAHLGVTVGAQYMEIRLDQARKLLRGGGLSVTEVALACGFSDAAHFSHRFAKRFGAPPSRWRAARGR